MYDLPPDCMEQEAAPSNRSDSFLPAVRCYEGETVYDYAWFPAMQAADPVSCVFASTSRVMHSYCKLGFCCCLCIDMHLVMLCKHPQYPVQTLHIL